MGFWDSVKAGFYRSAGIDDDSMKGNEEVRGLRSDLAAPPDAQHDEILSYMQFVNGTLGSLEPNVMQALPRALRGDDAGRVAWGLEAGPRCRIVRRTLDERTGANAWSHTPPAARQRGVDVVRLPGRRMDQISWRAHRVRRTLPDHGNRQLGEGGQRHLSSRRPIGAGPMSVSEILGALAIRDGFLACAIVMP